MDGGLSIGGASRTDFFRLKVNDAKTGYDVLQGLTDVVASPATVSHIAWSGVLVKGTSMEPQADGTMKGSIEQYDAGESIVDFLNKVAKPATTKSKPEIKFENGDKYGGASGTGGLVLAVSYLFHDDDDNPANVFVTMSIGRIAPTSGSQKSDGENYISLSCEFNSIPAAYTLSIPAACFQSTVVTQATPISFTKGKGFLRQYMTKAA